MILILKKIQEAIKASRESTDFTASEDLGHLFVAGTMSRIALLAWQAVFDEQCDWLTCHCKDESGDQIEPNKGSENENHRFNIQFNSPDTVPHLFTPEGWRSFLFNDAVISKATTVRLAFIENGFDTKAFSVEPWVDVPISVEPKEQKQSNKNSPRKLVRCQSPELMAPVRIEPWILADSAPDESCQAMTIWQEIAAQMVAKSLPNELYRDNDIPKVGLSGQPPRRLELGTFQSSNIPFQALQEAAAWVYLEGDDVEVRHTFLSTELARAWVPDVSFCSGLASHLAGALDSARLVYKAHLRSGSKDTLKALADLRKTLADEVQKLLQQARDLSSAVWRDVAIAIGVVAIRFTMPSIKANEVSSGFAVIFFLVALYISVSYAITISMNRRFLDIVETSRKSWRTKLYAFLDDNDYQTLADTPLTEATVAYQYTKKITTGVVVIIVFLLLIGAAFEMHWIEMERLIEFIKRILCLAVMSETPILATTQAGLFQPTY